MSLKEFESYSDDLDVFTKEAHLYAKRIITTENGVAPLSIIDVAQLVSIIIKTIPTHLSIRKKVRKDLLLPTIIANDPPSLRAVMWMVIIHAEVECHAKEAVFSKKFQKTPYAYELFTITRSWINAMDDVIDDATAINSNDSKPILPSKRELKKNTSVMEITSVLAQYFLKMYKENPKKRIHIQKTLREYRMIRDFEYELLVDTFGYVCEDFRKVTFNDDVSFDEAMTFNALAMSPITYLLIKTILNGEEIDTETDNQFKYAISLYATAGKLIDDLTDWGKDYYANELNMFTLAIKESGELEGLVANAEKFIKSKNHTFIPITLLKKWAPIAAERYWIEMDRLILALDKTSYKILSMSMKATRQIMWAYAANEGTSQVS